MKKFRAHPSGVAILADYIERYEKMKLDTLNEVKSHFDKIKDEICLEPGKMTEHEKSLIINELKQKFCTHYEREDTLAEVLHQNCFSNYCTLRGDLFFDLEKFIRDAGEREAIYSAFQKYVVGDNFDAEIEITESGADLKLISMRSYQQPKAKNDYKKMPIRSKVNNLFIIPVPEVLIDKAINYQVEVLKSKAKILAIKKPTIKLTNNKQNFELNR